MPGVPVTAYLDLNQTMGFIRDYDVRIDTIWNIYVVGISAIIAAANVKSWHPRPAVLMGAFVVFAAGNLWALSRYYSAHGALVDYAAAKSPPPGVLEALRLPGTQSLTAFHLVLDALVLAAIYLFTRRAQDAASTRT
jgi:hypothetical protein